MSFKKTGLYLLAILLLLPALFINLGLMTFIDDEGIRSLVALEMKLSANFITPTLHGEFYYKKPPLFNWILLCWYQVSGQVNEWNARIPTLIALLAYGTTIYTILRPKYGFSFAFIAAFLLITCGRILFWDSMLALIDITFSWTMFALFMVVYHQFKKGNFWQLFLLSYLLTAVGFMLKGLPAIVFQGTTLLTWFIYQKQFKRLFSLQHIAGGLFFLLLVGGYYLAYHQYNDLGNVFSTLFSESSKRTVVHFGIWDTIKHFFLFPLDMVYHFLPWSLFILLLIKRNIWSLLKKDAFIFFCALQFLANILVYWSSPEVYPRYLLMHAPLIFIVFLFLYREHKKEESLVFKVLDRLLFLICILISIGSFAPLFLEVTKSLPNVLPKVLVLSTSLIVLTIAYQLYKEKRLILIVLFLLVFRIGFNVFVLPDRQKNDFGTELKRTCIWYSRLYQDEELLVYKDTEMEPAISFYLTNSRGEIIPRAYEDFNKEAFYIIEEALYPDLEFEKLGEINQRHKRGELLIIGKLK